MAYSRRQLQYFTFAAGWHTAATEVAFPQNAVTNIINMDINRDGSVSKRLGLEGLSNSKTVTGTSEYSYINAFLWENVGGIGGEVNNVVQVGSTLLIYEQTNAVPTDIDLSAYASGSRSIADYPFQFASGNGKLYVVNPAMEPVYIDENLDVTRIYIYTRDFEGVDDGLQVDERPTELTDLHLYNLLNQGWPTESNLLNERRDAQTLNDVFQGNPIDDTFLRLDVYPSNADIYYLGKVGAADAASAIGAYRPYVLETQTFGNTPAPKGHHILNEFAKNRSEALEGLDVPTVSTTARPSAVCFFNGRLFMAGVPSSSGSVWSSNIYFSQQLESDEYVNYYFQKQDPTAEDFNDLLATDGGVLHVPEIGSVSAMHATGLGVIIFSENGVWELRGEADGVFSPLGYSVRKVTSYGLMSPTSIVEVAGTFMYWAEEGIIVLQKDDVSGSLVAQNITDRTIDNKYKEIVPVSKRSAAGAYDKTTNRVLWLYNDYFDADTGEQTTEEGVDVTTNYKNRALVLDLSLQCFYRYAFMAGELAQHIVSVTYGESLYNTTQQSVVTSQGITVTSNSSPVTSPASVFQTAEAAGFVFITRDGDSIELGSLSDGDFTDLGSTYPAFVDTAIVVGHSPSTRKTGDYVYTYVKEQQTGETGEPPA